MKLKTLAFKACDLNLTRELQVPLKSNCSKVPFLAIFLIYYSFPQSPISFMTILTFAIEKLIRCIITY